MKKALKAILVLSIIIFMAVGAFLLYKKYINPSSAPVESAVKQYQKELLYGGDTQE